MPTEYSDIPFNLPRRFLRMCKQYASHPKVADTTGANLTGSDLLLRTLILRRLLKRIGMQQDERYVGLLLPPTAAAVVANAALPMCGRIPVNLNYTLTSSVLNACIKQCNIRHVLTSRRVLEKFPLSIEAKLVFMEDFKDKVTVWDKVCAAAAAKALPHFMLEKLTGVDKLGPDDLMTVIFTSGSTGDPKGVMLTYQNVASNIAAIDELVHLSEKDVLLGILPFFHSFGYTTTLWTVLTLAPKGVYHISPLEPRQIGTLCRKENVTIIISTPTFLRSYLRRCEVEDFAHLDVVLAGAEKLPSDLCQAFEQKFNVRPVEGYGCTELSPLVAVNIPASRATQSGRVVSREGTVGRPIPRVQAKISHTETGEILGNNQSGMLWIKGPNVMQGYLNKPEQTARVIQDGWYKTGDIAEIDNDGFIKITGRESRFSKIGGEMVPHLKVEELLQRVLATGEEELKFVVTAIPDSRKGERLIVLHTELNQSPEEISRALAREGLPPIWVPSPDSYHQVSEIPVLGTGKLDLKRAKDLALEVFASQV